MNEVLKIINNTPSLVEHNSPATEIIDFHKIHQGKATNTLVKLKTKIGDPAQLNEYGDGIINEKDFKLFISKCNELTNGIRPTAKILLDALIITATESGQTDTTVKLPLADYMLMRGLKDIKTAREQVKNDLEALFRISLSFSENKKGKNENYIDMRICTTKGIVKGVIVFGFNEKFFKLIKDYPIMPYPREILSFNLNNNPNSPHLLRRISEHKNMNYGKANEDIIGVKTLIEASPPLPKYEEIKDIGGIEQRIIKPFERDMDAIESIKWNYCGKNGTQVEYPTTYTEFIQAKIKITWTSYPTRQLKHKASKKKPSENK